jgi:hypothetical protein
MWKTFKTWFIINIINIYMIKKIPSIQSSSSWKHERGPTGPDSNPSLEAVGSSLFDSGKAVWNLAILAGDNAEGGALPLSFCPLYSEYSKKTPFHVTFHDKYT